MISAPLDQFTTKRKTELDGANGMDGKKARVDQPSKVLHVRGLPPDVTDDELIAIACPFGRVANVLSLKGKGQAFIQMQDLLAATNLVQAYNSVQPSIRGRPIWFQYSNHEEITAPHSGGSGSGTDGANHVLLVTIMNAIYPITVDVIQQVFSKFGTLHKVIIFNKNGQIQALIQYASVHEATAAKIALEGQNIYSGCCTLHLQYSQLAQLTVKYNNDRSRDFTNLALPAQPPTAAVGMALVHQQQPAGMQWQQQQQMSRAPVLSHPSAMNVGMAPMNAMYAAPASPGAQFQPMQIGGYQMSAGYAAVPQSSQAAMQQLAAAAANQQQGRTVLIVSNLDPERVVLDELFMLFGVYGDVMRIKRLFNKPDTCLVQMTNALHAQLAVDYLNGPDGRARSTGGEVDPTRPKRCSAARPPAADQLLQAPVDLARPS
eukprot:TRINITY_DN143_c0_g2_i1.p1 TRINITY_DN143_c0_g2~~TRINITY_DN143_c0_g2_i1.p1  ORF type:complete len:432 (+),score=122.79 TRINITY_DN143_c0_g2_i1:194-1489(+)